MNLSSGRGSYGLWAIWPRFAISPRRPRGPPPPPDLLPSSPLDSPPLHLSLSSTSDSSPRSLSPLHPREALAPLRYRHRRRLGAPAPARAVPPVRGRSRPPALPDATRGCFVCPFPWLLAAPAGTLPCPGLLGPARPLRGAYLNAQRIAGGGLLLRCSWVLALA